MTWPPFLNDFYLMLFSRFVEISEICITDNSNRRPSKFKVIIRHPTGSDGDDEKDAEEAFESEERALETRILCQTYVQIAIVLPN